MFPHVYRDWPTSYLALHLNLPSCTYYFVHNIYVINRLSLKKNGSTVRNIRFTKYFLTSICCVVKARGGGGIHPHPCFPLSCAKTVNGRKLKLCDLWYKLVSFQFKHKLVSWDTHCCHGSTTVEECLLNFGLKSVGNCSFSA